MLKHLSGFFFFLIFGIFPNGLCVYYSCFSCSLYSSYWSFGIWGCVGHLFFNFNLLRHRYKREFLWILWVLILKFKKIKLCLLAQFRKQFFALSHCDWVWVLPSSFLYFFLSRTKTLINEGFVLRV